MPLSRQRRACVPWAPGTGRVTRVQLPQHTGAKTKPLLRGGLVQATWRPSWGSNQGCPTGDDAQPGLGHGGTAYPGRGSACPKWRVRPRDLDRATSFSPRTAHTRTHVHVQALVQTHVCTYTHMHMHTQVCSRTRSRPRTHIQTCTHSHTHTLSLSRVLTLRENSIELGSGRGVICFNY